jgi:hypothetical protein
MIAWPATCGCGSGEVPVAVAPGDADDRFSDLFTVQHGTPMRCMCMACWPRTAGRSTEAASPDA